MHKATGACTTVATQSVYVIEDGLQQLAGHLRFLWSLEVWKLASFAVLMYTQMKAMHLFRNKSVAYPDLLRLNDIRYVKEALSCSTYLRSSIQNVEPPLQRRRGRRPI
jgi:hypothetical protein